MGEKCQRCDGRGAVWIDLRSVGFGPGFYAFMAAGTRKVCGDDGSVKHSIVCPRCNGASAAPAAPGEKGD